MNCFSYLCIKMTEYEKICNHNGSGVVPGFVPVKA